MAYATNALDGARVYFEDDAGDGDPVVILGGLLDPVALVRRSPVAVALGELNEFRLIFIDHRGHGRSDTPHDTQAYAITARVADVVAVLDTLGIDRAHVIGLSWGGRLGFGIVEHAQPQVRSLVVVGQQPYEIDPEGPLIRVVEEALGDGEEPRIEPLVEAFEAVAGRYPDSVRELYLACDATAMRAAVWAALDEGDVSADLSRWDVPCLICVAAGDRDFLDQARRAAEEIPGARLVVVDDTDHLGMDIASVDPYLPAILETLRSSM